MLSKTTSSEPKDSKLGLLPKMRLPGIADDAEDSSNHGYE